MTTEEPFLASLSDDDVEEFRRLIASEYGEELSPAEARIRAQEVVSLMRMLALAPDPSPRPDESNADAPLPPVASDSR